ncbi:MAG: hypothetical protein Q9213_001380 [Squamulea squamosa]
MASTQSSQVLKKPAFQASSAPLPMDNGMISQGFDIEQRRYRLSRKAKTFESIEHTIEPDNPRHSAYPRDDPLIENLNDQDSYHRRSQVNNPDHVPEDASPPNSDPSYAPSPRARLRDPEVFLISSSARTFENNHKEDDNTQRMYVVGHHPDGTTSPEEEMASLIRAKREMTAALEVASSYDPWGQTLNDVEGRPMNSRSENQAAQIANLTREVAAITRRLDDLMTLYLKQQRAPQEQARWEGNVWPQTGDVTIRGFCSNSPAAMNESSAKSNNRRLGKLAVGGGPAESIKRTTQHSDKQSSNRFAATSGDTILQSMPSADVAGSRIMGVSRADNSENGSTTTSSKPPKHRVWGGLQPSDRGNGGTPASLARGLMHEWDTFHLPKTPSPSNWPKKQKLGQRRRQSSTMSPSNGITKHKQLSKVKGLLRSKQIVKPVPCSALTQDPTTSHDGSVPSNDTQRIDIGSSQQQKEMSTKRPALVGPGTGPADSSRYQAKPTTEQLAHNSNVRTSGPISSEPTTQGQMLGTALCRDSLGDAAKAGPQSTNTEDSLSGRQDQDPQSDASHGVRRLSASRELSELPDIETLLAEVGVQRKSSNVPSISTAVKSQLAELQGPSDSAMVGRTDAKLTTATSRVCPVLPQSESAKKAFHTIAKPSQPSQLSASLGATGLPKASSKPPCHKADGNDSSQSGVAAAHVEMPQDPYVVRQGTAATNTSLPSFQKVQKRRNRKPGRQFSSSPNTTKVQARSQSVRERKFVQRYVQPNSIADNPGMPDTNSTNSITANSLAETRPTIHPKTGASGVISRKCKCSLLPSYFRDPRFLEPSLETWWGGKLEFLTHCEQILNCPAHPDITQRTCRTILDHEGHNGENFQSGPLHNNHNRQYQDQMKRREHWNKRPQQQAQIKHLTHNASSQKIDEGSSPGLERCTNTKVANTNTLARPELSKHSIVPSVVESGGMPPFRMPPGVSLSPSARTEEVSIGQSDSNSKGPLSRSKHNPSKSSLKKCPNGLPTPAQTSSPSRTEFQETLHLPDDDYAPNWSQPSSPRPLHGSAPQSSVVAESNETSLPVPRPNDSVLANSKVAPKSSKKILKAVVIDNNPNSTVQGPGMNTKHQDIHQAGGNSRAARALHDKGFPGRRASHIIRRHATEPLNPSRPVSPATAVRRALQNPPRMALLFLSNPILHQQPATSSHACKPARPLHETTPPPTPPNTRKKRYISMDERKKLRPELSRYVEKDKRLSDELLIEVGRERLTYARHSAAPYAFSYDGKLYEEYHHRLTKMVDDDGKSLWDETLVKRLSKK